MTDGEHHNDGQPAGFPSHLSVGQVLGKPEMLRLVAELQAVWQPVRFAVSGISLIWRGEPPDDVCHVAATVPLMSEGPA